nr:MAG TPA: hypothetical protein [Caudoviricetes sp.]DAH25172.1 MAG TPA: hypothetical protein [Bacteriophage sp.]
MKSREEILIKMLSKKLPEVNTADGIKNLLNDFFELADDFETSMTSQWTMVGYVFDLFRKGEL